MNQDPNNIPLDRLFFVDGPIPRVKSSIHSSRDSLASARPARSRTRSPSARSRPARTRSPRSPRSSLSIPAEYADFMSVPLDTLRFVNGNPTIRSSRASARWSVSSLPSSIASYDASSNASSNASGNASLRSDVLLRSGSGSGSGSLSAEDVDDAVCTIPVFPVRAKNQIHINRGGDALAIAFESSEPKVGPVPAQSYELMRSFLRQSTYSVLTNKSISCITLVATLHPDVPSPFLSIRSSSFGRPLRKLLVKVFLTRKDADVPDQRVFLMNRERNELRPVTQAEFNQEARIQHDIYQKTYGSSFEAVCPLVLFAATIKDRAEYLSLFQRMEKQSDKNQIDDFLTFPDRTPYLTQNYHVSVLCMEWLEGYMTLADMLRDRRFTDRHKCMVKAYVMYELSRLHQVGYFQTDPHNENVMVHPDMSFYIHSPDPDFRGHVLLIDFGRMARINPPTTPLDVLRKVLHEDTSRFRYFKTVNHFLGWIQEIQYQRSTFFKSQLEARIHDPNGPFYELFQTKPAGQSWSEFMHAFVSREYFTRIQHQLHVQLEQSERLGKRKRQKRRVSCKAKATRSSKAKATRSSKAKGKRYTKKKCTRKKSNRM